MNHNVLHELINLTEALEGVEHEKKLNDLDYIVKYLGEQPFDAASFLNTVRYKCDYDKKMPIIDHFSSSLSTAFQFLANNPTISDGAKTFLANTLLSEYKKNNNIIFAENDEIILEKCKNEQNTIIIDEKSLWHVARIFLEIITKNILTEKQINDCCRNILRQAHLELNSLTNTQPETISILKKILDVQEILLKLNILNK